MGSTVKNSIAFLTLQAILVREEEISSLLHTRLAPIVRYTEVLQNASRLVAKWPMARKKVNHGFNIHYSRLCHVSCVMTQSSLLLLGNDTTLVTDLLAMALLVFQAAAAGTGIVAPRFVSGRLSYNDRSLFGSRL